MRRVFVLLLIHVSCSLFSQAPDVSTLLSVNDGLSQGMVFDVFQSRDGFLWIATKDGLSRYDGYHFEVFSPDAFDPFSIGASEIWRIFEDNRGWLWIIYSGGLDIFMPENGRFFHLPKQLVPDYLARPYYDFSFAETPDGAVWIEENGRLWKIAMPQAILEKAAKTGNAFPNLLSKRIDITASGSPGAPVQVTSLFFGKNKTLLAGTTHGLYTIDLVSGQVQPAALSGAVVSVLGEDSVGQVWLLSNFRSDPEVKPGENMQVSKQGLDVGFWVWKNNRATFRKWLDISPTKCKFDYKDQIWTLHGDTLRKWPTATLASDSKPEFEWICKEPFSGSTIFGFDRSGLVWLGTNGYGVLKIIPGKPNFSTCLPATSLYSIVETPQGKLFAFANHWTLYSSNTFDRTETNPWISKYPKAAIGFLPVFDSAGNCWSVPYNQSILFRIDAHTKAVRAFPWKGLGLWYGNGKLFSIDKKGLVEFDPVTEIQAFHPFKEPSKIFDTNDPNLYLFVDAEGVIWISAFDGLVKASPTGAGYRFEHFKNKPADRTSLSNDFVLCFAEDALEPQRYLWVGTKGGGLNRLDRQSGKFQHYKTAQGLPDNVVYGILPDKNGHLWMSTNRGLCRFHARKETVKNFSFADGLQGNEFNRGASLKTKDGVMIFGGVNGLTVFHPDSLRFNEYVPQTQIVGLKINNEPYNPKAREPFTFSYKQNLLALEFVALDFHNPLRNRYRYRLLQNKAINSENDETWVDLGEKNTVQFANLQPGSYTIEVLGSNNDDIWSAQPAVLRFTIRPPWWASWWAWLLYIAIAVAGIRLLYLYQLRQRLEHQETKRLRELDDFKSRFFTNLTHEFRTPLTVILGMTNQLTVGSWRALVGGPEQSRIANGLKMIENNGKNLLRLINQLLDLSKLENKSFQLHMQQGDILPYLRYLTESFQTYANSHKITLRFLTALESLVMDYDPEQIKQVMTNLLSNALKFTPENGHIQLIVDTAPNPTAAFPQIRIKVEDTGIGIAERDLPHIFDRYYQVDSHTREGEGTGIGLAHTLELVKIMGGTISVESKINKGSVFTLLLPISQNAPISDKEGASVARTAAPISADEQAIRHAAPLAPPSSFPQLLLIEDNPDVVVYLKSCLEGLYQVNVAYNGKTGIEKALEQIPDLIISDVMMPEKDGFQVCDTLKNDERTSHIPIILLTAKADAGSKVAGLRRGADAYLTKPFDREELLVRLEMLVERQKRMAAYFSKNRKNSSGQSLPETDVEEAIQVEDAFIRKLRNIVEENYSDEDFGLPQLCLKIGMSRSQLFRKMKAVTNTAPSDLIRSHRLNCARALLENGEITVAEAAWQVGFKDPSYFSKLFQEEFGEAPSAIRK